jgi:hypothetical protein
MKTIISKRYALNIPIIYLFIIPFFICLLFGYLLFFLVFGEYNKENSINENNHFLFLLPSFIFLGCLVPIYIYWKNAPSIAINNQIIKIRNKTFFLNDIKEILTIPCKVLLFILRMEKNVFYLTICMQMFLK